MHGFDLGNKFYRLRQLPCQEFPGLGFFGRVFGGGGIGKYRDAAGGEFDFGQCGQEWCGGICHQGAVEGGGHRQLLAGQFAGLAGADRPGDFVTAPGKYGLGRGVTVSNDQIEFFFSQHLLYVCQRRGDRQHAAFIASATCHQVATQT